MSAQTALLIGASGQTGQHLLKVLLNSPKFSQVFEYGRRVTDLESISHGKEKLQQKVIDFEKLSESGLKDGQWDVVFITLGTTRKNAGSADSFEKIDREYVINSAREARTDGKDQRLVYLSSAGADASSSFLYTKSKGLTELGLASLGYKETIIFRPAVLAGVSRPESRPFETFGRYVTSVLSHVTSSVEIKVGTLAKAMAKAGSLGSASLPAIAHATQEGKEGALFTVIRNSGAIALADSEL